MVSSKAILEEIEKKLSAVPGAMTDEKRTLWEATQGQTLALLAIAYQLAQMNERQARGNFESEVEQHKIVIKK